MTLVITLTFSCYSATLEAQEAGIEQLEQTLDKVCHHMYFFS